VKEGHIEIVPKWAATFQDLNHGAARVCDLAMQAKVSAPTVALQSGPHQRLATAIGHKLVKLLGDWLGRREPQIPVRPSVAIVVFNPLGWDRDDVVQAHVTLYGDVVPGDIGDYRKGMRLVDEAGRDVPFHIEQYSENISRALEVVFVAKGVPSLGYKTYYLRPADGPASLPQAAQITLDNSNDVKEPRRALGSDVMENEFYRVTVDRATGRVTLFDKTLQRDVLKNAIAGAEERGGNYIGIEPLSGRSFPQSIDRVEVEANNGIRAVMKTSGHLIDMPETQRLILYKDLKRLDIENTVEWRGPRLVRVEQLFPYQAPNAQIEYGVAYGSNDSGNLIPNTEPHMPDEIRKESWLQARHIQNWIFAGSSEWGLTLATGEQFVRLEGGMFRGEMLRGAHDTSVKVVRGDAVGSMDYPPKGIYTFRYSLSSGRGDWRASKSYRAGMNFNNALIPISVVDNISEKSLPPSQSFFSTGADTLVLSAVRRRTTATESCCASLRMKERARQRAFGSSARRAAWRS